VIVEEGKVRIFAPHVNIKGPGRVEGVFYNREMVINRDSTILLLHNLKVKSALDGLAATGVRGIRMIKECGVITTINDIDPKAVEIIKKNVEMNNVNANITQRNVNALMAEEKFDYMDIDPFGSPVPFIDMALKSGKIIGISATDTATLGGRNRKIERRYLANVSSPTPYVHEIGIRVLLGYIGRMAAKFDLGIRPIFSMWHGHFYRVYIKIEKGVSKSKATLKNIGLCEYGGPLWLGELHDFSFLKEIKIPEWLPNKDKFEKYRELWKGERFFLFHHIPTLASELKVSTPPIKKIIQILRDMGYEAYRTQFSPQGIKSNASLEEVKNILSTYHNF